MSGTLLIKRPAQFADMLRRYRLHVDGRHVPSIKFNGELTLDLPPGPHQLLARLDWCSSNVLDITIHPDQTTEVEVGSNVAGLRAFVAPFYVTFYRDQYLYLRLTPRGFPVQPPSHPPPPPTP